MALDVFVQKFNFVLELPECLLLSNDIVNGLFTGTDAHDNDDDADTDDVKFIGMIVGALSGGLLCIIILAVVIVSCLYRSACSLLILLSQFI